MPASPSPPPPASAFNFMSGNFDFPPSTSPPPARGSLSFSRYQRLLERQDTDWPLPAADNEDVTMPPRRPRVTRQLRRPVSSDREQQDPSTSLLRIPYPPTTSSTSRPVSSDREQPDTSTSRLRIPFPPTTLSASRPRATPSERYLRRSHPRLREQVAAELDSTSDVFDSLAEMQERNPFTIAASTIRARSPVPDLDPTRRAKRRKLDHSLVKTPYDGFKYGHKGQVVSGRLKMEIASCDGGEYEKYGPSGLYPIQNVLKNDKSVYCSERSRCNLLLKHIGEMPFTLERVVIRAPDRGFTAPVQEGLIFVAMSSNDLIARTSQYQIDYESASSRSSPVPSLQMEQQLSLRDAVEDPYLWEHSRQGRQEAMEEQIERLRLRTHRGQAQSTTRSNRERRRQERRITGQEDDDMFAENCDYPAEDYRPPAGVSAPTPPPFTISTESEEEDSDSNAEMPSAAIMADRLRRESRWRAESDEDDDDLLYRFPPPRRSFALDSLDNYGERRWRAERYLEPIRATRLGAPSRIEPNDSQPDSDGLIAPHARFFIAKHKNKITIKFHPAVSGKFVLLKLWSPTHDGNIDIESTQFYGYSGPRFFPASHPC